MAEQNPAVAEDWAPRGAMRGLLWWPPVAFVLVVAVPGLWLPCVAVSGLVLAVVGAGSARIGLRRRRAEPSRAAPQVTEVLQRAA